MEDNIGKFLLVVYKGLYVFKIKKTKPLLNKANAASAAKGLGT